MGKIKEITGLKFGRLTVLSMNTEKRKTYDKYWNCVCECGKIVSVNGASLRGGHTRSCGCYRVDRAIETNIKHGYCMNKKNHVLTNVHNAIKMRCENKNTNNYKNYGGRGIKVCEEWKELGNFIKWAESNGYRKGLTIDRIDNNGNYEPSNCRWVTHKEQGNNKRNNVIVGDTGLTLTQYCEINNVSIKNVCQRIKRKKDFHDLIPHELKRRG